MSRSEGRVPGNGVCVYRAVLNNLSLCAVNPADGRGWSGGGVGRWRTGWDLRTCIARDQCRFRFRAGGGRGEQEKKKPLITIFGGRRAVNKPPKVYAFRRPAVRRSADGKF